MIPDRFSSAFFACSKPTLRDVVSSFLPSLVRRRNNGDQQRHEVLARELESLVESRLQNAVEPKRELLRIVAELRALGHPLELDEDAADRTIYCDLPQRNLAVWAHWSIGGLGHVEVLWQKM